MLSQFEHCVIHSRLPEEQVNPCFLDLFNLRMCKCLLSWPHVFSLLAVTTSYSASSFPWTKPPPLSICLSPLSNYATLFMSGIMALCATSSYYDATEIATRILPNIVVLTIDPDKYYSLLIVILVVFENYILLV